MKKSPQKSSTRKPAPKKNNIKPWQMITAGILVVGFILYLVLFNNPASEETKEMYEFNKEGEMIFLDSLNHVKTKIDIEIADSEYDRQLGLMFRVKMKENQGMLFIFPEERFQSFWMRNTNLSLDIIFANANKEIVNIHKNTTPLAETSYPSSGPALYVLEVNAGFTDKYNIQAGDKLNWMEMRKD